MTALDPGPRALPQIGQRRPVLLVKTGWHVHTDGAWRLVTDARRARYDRGPMILTMRDSVNGEGATTFGKGETLMTRTPEEQIQHIEAERLERHGGGPVSRMHLDDQTEAVLRDAYKGGCPTCGRGAGA